MYDEWIYQTDSFQTPPQPQQSPVALAPSSPHLDRPKTRKRGKSLLQSVAIDGNVSTENSLIQYTKMSIPVSIFFNKFRHTKAIPINVIIHLLNQIFL